MSDKYVVLCETSGEDLEQWYYFLKYNGNETMLKYLQDQLEKVDMFILDDLSIFDLDLDHFFCEQTAKEMTRLEVNAFFHRKFDGTLKPINFNLRKKDSTERKLEKINKILGDQGISEYIDQEDENSEAESVSDSSEDCDSENECLVPIPTNLPPNTYHNDSDDDSDIGEITAQTNNIRLPDAVSKIAGKRQRKKK